MGLARDRSAPAELLAGWIAAVRRRRARSGGAVDLDLRGRRARHGTSLSGLGARGPLARCRFSLRDPDRRRRRPVSDRAGHRPLHVALLELLRARGLAGATVVKGVAGFGANSVIHTSSILRLSEDLPLVIEVVDTAEHLEAVLPEVDRLMKGGLITMEKVRVLRYAPDEKG